MKVYSEFDEECIRDGNLVHEWIASGLLDRPQGDALLGELRTDLRRTNGFLRAVLWIFTSLIVIAGVALLVDFFRPDEPAQWGVLLVVTGLVCWTAAELAVGRRLYRYGIEEAFGVVSVVLLSLGSTLLFSSPSEYFAAGLVACSIGGSALYVRFGFVYGAVGGLAAIAAFPFQLDLSIDGKRLTSAILVAIVIACVRLRRRAQTTEPAGSGLPTIEAAAWLALYLVLNLQLSAAIFGVPNLQIDAPHWTPAAVNSTWFYILSWSLIWLLPVGGMWQGLRRRDRLLLDVSLVMSLLTLATNKRYLGWIMHTWDPMVLGLVLMSAAILIRRWLQRGLNGERSGYTAVRILQSDERKLAAAGIASSVMQPLASTPGQASAPQDFKGGGGISGGGGAGGTF